jgi:hypothetical protein
MLAKIEGRWPLWSLTTAVCGVFISLIVFVNCCAWIVAAYRPETGADVIQSWYDWAWFAFLLGWIYLAIEMFATAAVEFMDHRPEPMVPRWLTWLTIVGAATLFFAAGPAFFKSGPFAYHWLLAFYLSVVIWGTGSPKREFLYVDDMASACVHVMDLPREVYAAHTEVMASHINVGTGEDLSIAEIAQMVSDAVG